MHVLHRGEENPACTLGVCAMYCVTMSQIAFELLPKTADYPDVCVYSCTRACVHVHIFMCVSVCKGEVRKAEGNGLWKAVC